MDSLTSSISDKLKQEIKSEFLRIKIKDRRSALRHNSSSLQYAHAMFQISSELDIVNKVREDFSLLIDTLVNDEDIFNFFVSNFIDIKTKIKVLNKVYKEKIEVEVLNLISILLERNLVKLLEDTIYEYERLAAEFYNIYKVKVSTAKKIDDIMQLENAIVKLIGHDIEMTVTEDESLISGIVVNIGGTIYDYSIKNELSNLKKLLLDCDISNITENIVS